MIFGPQYSQRVTRVQPVSSDHQEESDREEQQKSVLYQGREWTEREEELPVHPPSNFIPSSEHSLGVYADRRLLEQAYAYFNQLITLEQKAAQLCFVLTEAMYNTALQNEVEQLIQAHQIGGILFRKGMYRRQAYLVERYQEISELPLLMANDFLHGLSFYLLGDQLPKEEISEKHFSDLGKTVMVQNRRLGVHIQFDRERDSEDVPMNEGQAKAFRKGIREAHGIVGKEKTERQQQSYGHSVKGTFPFASVKNAGPMLSSVFSEYQVLETIGFKTFTFFDATRDDGVGLEEKILQAFDQHYDVFLFSHEIPEAIQLITRLVRTGKIRQEVFDRHVMKSLIIKSLFF